MQLICFDISLSLFMIINVSCDLKKNTLKYLFQENIVHIQLIF